MNKKDVLGLRLLPGITEKMKSVPVGVSAGIAQNTALNQGKGKAWFWRIWYLIQAKTKAKKF